MGEEGYSSMNDNKLSLNETFDDIKDLGKQFLQWMKCGQQVELGEMGPAPKRPGTVALKELDCLS